jgi:DNA-binding ferritin-like protein
MDDQKVAALTQVLQQAVQILQSISGGAADPNADPNADPAMMDDGDPDNLDPTMGDAADPNADPNADPSMGGMGQPGLHDRVEQLESHTGLKKSATAGLSIEERLEQLEEIHLDTAFDGEIVDRIAQLESVPKLAKSLAKSATTEAPDQIDIAELLDAAVQRGRDSVLAELRKTTAVATKSKDEVAPDLGQLRSVGIRRAQSPQALEKSANEELASVGFGGALQGLYLMHQNGMATGFGADEDSDE